MEKKGSRATKLRTREKKNMRYGLYVPNFGKGSSPRKYVEMAIEAEKAGWDGFFLWDHLVEWKKRVALHDSFIVLAAIASKTSRIRIGTTVTPLPRFKPWIVARQVATLDNLSNGRMILGVGLGGEESSDPERFGESANTKILAEKLDESLEIVSGLWSGKEFTFKGKHYNVGSSAFLPAPMQEPRIPIWVGGMWPRKGPFMRAARWDGMIPLTAPGELLDASELPEILSFVKKSRNNLSNFDVAIIGWTSGRDRHENAKKVAPYLKSGATWWLDSLYGERDSPELMLKRIRLGPPTEQSNKQARRNGI